MRGEPVGARRRGKVGLRALQVFGNCSRVIALVLVDRSRFIGERVIVSKLGTAVLDHAQRVVIQEVIPDRR